MTAQDFVFKIAPYKKVEGEEYDELYKELANDRLSINGYNPRRNVETTFHLCSYDIEKSHRNISRNYFEPSDDKVRCLSFQCGRYGDILTLLVYNNEEESYLFKIGTFPSLREFHKDDVKKYYKVLSEQQRTELITAIMIAGNGVGIGSYVYLRRVFEGIVDEESEKALCEGIITRDEIENKRMDEKILLLKDFLPAFLYNHHKELYSVLSIGVHQLDEEDCLNFFPILYDCILMILEDRLAQKERQELAKKASASLSKIVATIKK